MAFDVLTEEYRNVLAEMARNPNRRIEQWAIWAALGEIGRLRTEVDAARSERGELLKHLNHLRDEAEAVAFANRRGYQGAPYESGRAFGLGEAIAAIEDRP